MPIETSKNCPLLHVLILSFLSHVPLCALGQDAPDGTKRMRIYMIGNSLTDNVRYESFQKLAESKGYEHVWGRSMTPGAPIRWHWEHDPAFTQKPFGAYRKALVEYEWDAITFQPFSNFRQEFDALLKFIELLQPKNGKAQIFIYAQWPNKGKGDWDTLFSGPPIDDLAHWYSNNSVREYYDRFVPELRKACPDMKPARLIPAGHAMYLLSQKIKAGHVLGLKSILDLYRDGVHLNNVGACIAGLSFYATIYGRSPIGVTCEPYQLAESETGISITPELARILHETVWETVATHPLTGVTSDEPVKVASPVLAEGVASKTYGTLLLPAYGKYPYQWALDAGRLPQGLELKGNGRIEGTPAAPGESIFTVRVTDAKGRTATRELSLMVATDSKPQIVDVELPAARTGAYYRHTLRADGGNGTLTWRLARKESMPAGLSLEPDGSIWGTPVKEGSFPFTVEVQDADLSSPDVAGRKLSLQVGPADADVVSVRRVEPRSITVDGKLDEGCWKLDRRIEKQVDGGKTAIEASFDVVTDGDGLILAFRVKDPNVKDGPADEPWKGDSVEVFIDALNNRETVYNAEDRRFVISPKGKLYAVGGTRSVKAAAQKTADGYTVEVDISNWNLGVKLYDRAIGLDVAVNDSDDGQARTCRLVWRGSKDNETDPSGFASVILPEREKRN